MKDKVCAEFDALIAANKISIARKRYVRAAGNQLCFWQLNLDASKPISSAFKDGLDSLIDGVEIDIEKPF